MHVTFVNTEITRVVSNVSCDTNGQRGSPKIKRPSYCGTHFVYPICNRVNDRHVTGVQTTIQLLHMDCVTDRELNERFRSNTLAARISYIVFQIVVRYYTGKVSKSREPVQKYTLNLETNYFCLPIYCTRVSRFHTRTHILSCSTRTIQTTRKIVH